MKKIRILYIFILATAVAGSTFLGSGSSIFEKARAAAWKSIGPAGGQVRALVVDPTATNNIFAVNYQSPGRFFISTNRGVSWTKRAVFDYGAAIYDVAVTPGHPNTLFVLAGSKIFKSMDRGASWTLTELNENFNAVEGRLYISPSNPNTIFIAGGHAYQSDPNFYQCMTILRSTDGGATWAPTDLEPDSSSGHMHYFAGNASQPQTLYAAGYWKSRWGIDGHSIYKSIDNGNTWTKIARATKYITGLAVHPRDARQVWYSSWGGVFRSTDGGISWKPNKGLISAYALALDRTDPRILYIGTAGGRGCFKSIDSGLNWSCGTISPPGTARTILADGTSVLVGSDCGIYRSINAGMSFRASQTGFIASRITALASAPSDPSIMYVESNGAALYKSTNEGTKWKALPYFYRCDAILRIIVEPSNPNNIFILAGG